MEDQIIVITDVTLVCIAKKQQYTEEDYQKLGEELFKYEPPILEINEINANDFKDLQYDDVLNSRISTPKLNANQIGKAYSHNLFNNNPPNIENDSIP